MELVRIRTVFGDGDILSKSQKSDGLKRSWLLLKPQHETISDVISHLLHSFDLHRSCPNGLLLSMDGFILPPFESTSILKDKDRIRVKRKGAKFSATANAINGARASVEEDIVEKQPLVLLANETFEIEKGDSQSEPEEDEDGKQPDALHVESTRRATSISKKRKASKKIQSLKRKRQRQVSPDEKLAQKEAATGRDSVEKLAQKKHSGSRQHDETAQKRKSSDSGSEQDPMHTPGVAQKTSNVVLPKPDSKSIDEEKRTGTVALSGLRDGTKKVSRSTLRKRAQRKWRREMLNAEKEKEEVRKRLPLDDSNIDSGDRNGSNLNTALELQKRHRAKKDSDAHLETRKDSNANTIKGSDQDSDAEGDIVPIVIRPGHIRFAPYGKEKDVQQSQEAKESFHWNGITSKRKGQKWGKERQSMPQWNESRNLNRTYSCRRVTQKEQPLKGVLDFEQLVPLTDLPKQGDTIAYRLLELSSLFCPELSSFRVGKILWFKPESNMIMLVTVPEYPFHFENKTDEDADGLATDSSHYKEDGSLEIDFQSLVDVRIVKRGDFSSLEAAQDVVEKAPAASKRDSLAPISDKVAPSDIQPASNNTEVHSPAPEIDVWEEISEALNAKKAQLQQEDNWNKKDISNKRPWSYRTLRSSALGPTVALLRQQNGI